MEALRQESTTHTCSEATPKECTGRSFRHEQSFSNYNNDVLIKIDTIQLRSEPMQMYSFQLMKVFFKIWNLFSQILMTNKLGYIIYFAGKSTLALLLLLFEILQFNKKQTSYSFLIIIGLICIQLVIYFVMKIAYKVKSAFTSIAENLFITIYANIMMFMLFTVSLFDCTQSLVFSPGTLTLTQCAIGYIYEAPEIVFGVLEIALITLFVATIAFESLILILICKFKFTKKPTRDVEIHTYLFNEQMYERLCVICQCDFIKNDYISRLMCKCKATYHKHCIAEWYLRSEECPLCKSHTKIM